jgi:hypothetical protein
VHASFGFTFDFVHVVTGFEFCETLRSARADARRLDNRPDRPPVRLQPLRRTDPYSGQGRPPEYCPDRRWDGNRTCKQLAAAERAGERAAALELPLESFRHAGERFVPAAQDVGPSACGGRRGGG